MAASTVVPSTGPATQVYAITPNDGADLTVAARGIWVGGAGNIKVTTIDGQTETLNGALAGSVIPVCVKRVWATGTTATLMLALR